MDWEQIKAAISLWTGLERDALHIYAAILTQLAAALLLRRSLASPLPWLAVLAVALLNEALDMYGDGLAEDWERDSALHDLWNSMLVPTLLALLVRFAPGLARPPAPPEGSG